MINVKPLIILLLFTSYIFLPASAVDNVTNSTNITLMDPVILSFMGGHMFGENPVEILNNETGRVSFVGDTGSKWINLSPDRGYLIRVEPSGISDAANSPDAGVVGAMMWVEKNPLGTFMYSTLIAGCLVVWKKKRN